MTQSAHREAIVYFEQALSALSHLPETRATCEQAIDLRLALRTPLADSGHLRRALACLREAEALAVALDDARRLADVSLFLSRHFSFMGMYEQAITTLQHALTLATASGDIVLHALGHQRLGVASLHKGDYRRAIDCFRQTAASLDGARRHEHFGQNPMPAASARAWLAVCHAELGEFPEGRARGEEGLRIAETGDHSASLTIVSWGIGLLFLRQGDLHQALLRLEQAMGICHDADLPIFFLPIAGALGAAYTLGGRVADAVVLLTQTMAQPMATELVEFQALCHLSLGEAQLLVDRLEEAQVLATQALTLTREHKERGNEAYALRLLGDIAARRDPPEVAQAETYYRQALTLAEELGMRPLQAHCRRGLGTLYARHGHWAQARPELDVACDLYRAMDMTFWLPQVEAVLAQVEAQ